MIKPCEKFADIKPYDQLHHVTTEYAEVIQAYKAYIKEMDIEKHNEKLFHLVEECVDLQISLQTFMATLGVCEEYVDNVRKIVNEKNEKRGYHGKRLD